MNYVNDGSVSRRNLNLKTLPCDLKLLFPLRSLQELVLDAENFDDNAEGSSRR